MAKKQAVVEPDTTRMSAQNKAYGAAMSRLREEEKV